MLTKIESDTSLAGLPVRRHVLLKIKDFLVKYLSLSWYYYTVGSCAGCVFEDKCDEP
jgi:hypothetical protein